jgi:hypothetical protein
MVCPVDVDEAARTLALLGMPKLSGKERLALAHQRKVQRKRDYNQVHRKKKSLQLAEVLSSLCSLSSLPSKC